MAYTPPGISKLPQGIDVSNHQGHVDWAAVAKAGKAFAFIKATQGDYFVDPYFAQNRARAKAAGLLVGAYHFFDPRVDAVKQAAFFHKVVGAIPQGELVPALDFESLGNENGLTGREVPRDEAIHSAVVWLTEVQKLTGRQPAFYSYTYFIKNQLGDTHRFSGNAANGDPGFPLWIARYGVPKPVLAGGWSQYAWWQYDSVGRCPGVAGDCDMNVFNGSLAQLRKYAGYP